MSKPNKSILRIFAGYMLGAAGMGVIFILLILFWIFFSNTHVMVRDGLYGQAQDVAANIVVGGNGSINVHMHQPMQWAYDAFYANLKYEVLDGDGNLLASSDKEGDRLLPGYRLEIDKLPEYFTLRTAYGELYVGAFHFEKDGKNFIVQTARSDRFSELAEEAIMPAVFETAGVLVLGSLLVFFVALYFAVRAAVRQISDVSSAAENINPEALDVRLDVASAPGELVPLVVAFNKVLDRLAESFRSQQRFVANVAHELKTPLAILRAQVELNTDQTLREKLLIDIDDMNRKVRQMMHLLQAQDKRNYYVERIDLFSIARDVKQSFSGFPDLADKVLELSGRNPEYSRGDGAALFTALKNLVENAIKATPDGGCISIRVLDNGFEVTDQGNGFDESIKHLMFARFWHADTSGSGGTGLGLNIVNEIVRAHGGTLSASNLPDGSGARFVLSLGC